MKRFSTVLVAIGLVAGGCGSDTTTDTAGQATTTTAAATTSTAGATSTSAPASTQAATTATSAPRATTTTATSKSAAATAVIEPHAVAGIPLGANKSQAIAVLGSPTKTGQETDLGGKKYDYLRWELDGIRGLTLNFRTESVTSPLLTDWQASAAGPATKKAVQVGDSASKVTAAYGPLKPFCCGSQVAEETQGGGRMIVVVDSASQKVQQIIGGDPAYWSRSIAD